MSTPAPSTNDNGPHSIELLQWICCAPYEELLGISIIEADGGKAVLKMPFDRRLAQGFGLMHGGALVSLADTAVVMAIKSLLPPDSRFATTQIQAEYLKPVVQGTVTATAEISYRDGRNLFGGSEITSEDGTRVLSCTCRFRIARDVPEECLESLPLTEKHTTRVPR